MATVVKNGKGWRAQIRRLGHPPLSRTFPLKTQAQEWAIVTERQLLSGHFVAAHKHTLREAFEKYAEEVSPKKRGGRWEQYRLLADPLRLAPMASKAIGSITATDISAWRDKRLQAVSGATVRREMNLLASVFRVAIREWRWVGQSPMLEVDKPVNPRSRRRRVTQAEIGMLSDKLTGPAGKEILAGFLLGIETGMRAGEMWSLERGQIYLDRRYVHLEKTKNGDERDVALSPAAIAIISALLKDKRKTLFLTSLGVRDTLFRKARDAAGIKNLHFHDSRSEAIYRLSKKLDVLELARQIGHRDIRSLMIYFEADAAELARKLG